jgi:hypothetical protein
VSAAEIYFAKQIERGIKSGKGICFENCIKGEIMRCLSLLLALTLVTGALAAECTARENKADLAKEAQNPVANMISLPLQNNTSFNIGPYDRRSNVLNIQPVVPFLDGRLITRTILPVIYAPDLASESGGTNGIGDLNITAFYSPQTESLTWGAGPVLFFPTGGDETGSRKWTAGPSVVALATPGPWVFGVLWNNVWSYAGEEDAPDVNRMLLQYFINYNFSGFYLVSAPVITADWKAEEGQKWVVPFGVGIGKLLKVGKLPLNCTAQYYYNAVKPDYGPDWSLRLQIQALFPR